MAKVITVHEALRDAMAEPCVWTVRYLLWAKGC